MLLLVAVVATFFYMWTYFGSGRFAGMAAMQLVLALPLMFFFVDLVFRQRPISAFACCSLWVVTGVSADNIFVVHETWAKSTRLRLRGAPASLEQRVIWTLREAARPLIIAYATTAFALFVNCISPIPAIFQFGLCGGLLIL